MNNSSNCGEDVFIILLGNKCDKEHSIVVDDNEIKEKQEILKLKHYFKVSAKYNQNKLNDILKKIIIITKKILILILKIIITKIFRLKNYLKKTHCYKN